MAFKTVTGIELFGDDLRIVVLAGMTRKVRVTESVVLEGFASLDSAERVERLASIVRTRRIRTGNVYLVLPANLGTVREIDIPSAAADPAEAAALQLESISPWSIEDIWWTAGLPPESGSARSKRAFRPAIVSIVPAEVARSWVDVFSNAGLPLAGLSLASAAWADGIVRLFGSERPGMSLTLAGDRIEGVLVAGDRTVVFTDTWTSDISRAVGQAVAGLLGAARVEDPDTVRLIARGPIPETLRPLAITTIPVDPGATRIDDFGAIAAALAAGRGRSSNLIPTAHREKRDVVGAVPTIVLAACLLVAVTALLVREPYQFMLYSQRLDAEIAELEPLVDDVISEDTELETAREEFALLDALIVDDRNLEALAWLAGSMPLDTWITSYSNQGSVLTLSGYSRATSQFQLLLEDSDLFQGVELASPVTRDSAGRERFTIRMNVVGAS